MDHLHLWGLSEIFHCMSIVDNLPSFSMGLTQDFGVDVGSMVKSKQVQHEQTIEEFEIKEKI